MALTWASWPTAAAISSAVASCSRRCQPAAKPRRGSRMVSSVCAVGHRLGRQLQGGAGQPSVLALHDVEGQPGQAQPAPLRLQLGRDPAVQGEVDGPQLVGMEGPGVLQGPGRGHVQPVDQHDDRVPVEHRRLGGLGRPHLQLLLLVCVLPVEGQEGQDADGQDDQDDPGPLGELGYGDDDQDDEGEHRGRAVDDQPTAPMVLSVVQVVLGHAGPGHGEAGEHADGVQRDELVHLGVGDPQAG